VERHEHVREYVGMQRDDSRRRRDDRLAPDVWRDREILAPRVVVAAVALTKLLLREIALCLVPPSCQRRDFDIDRRMSEDMRKCRKTIERIILLGFYIFYIFY